MKIADLLRADQKSALLSLKPSLKQNPAYIEEQRMKLAKAIEEHKQSELDAFHTQLQKKFERKTGPDWPEFSEGCDI